MKKTFLESIFCLFSILLQSQVPQAISYQAVAYDSKGEPIKNPISLKISILDNSDKGTVVYAETHKGIQPIENGLYSLNIGHGKPEPNKEAVKGESDTYSFSKIKWGTNNKFLKIEMDSSGKGEGTNYILVGTNQLMSVPYALASSSCNESCSVITLRNIDQLKYQPVDLSLDDITVYVKGYTFPSDGGGGTFIFKKFNEMFPVYDATTNQITYVSHPNLHPQDDKGVFISSYDTAYSEQGIWVRQFNGEIDVRYYGAMGLGGDDTEAIQAAIDYASKSTADGSTGNETSTRQYGYSRSNIVFLPNGDYKVRQLVLKSGVTIKGSSTLHTRILSLNTDDGALITIGAGIVEHVHVSGITFIGNLDESKNYKSCFYIAAHSDKKGQAGGLWNSSFKDIYILKFRGHGMNFVGGTGTNVGNIVYILLNQFLTFEGVNIDGCGQIKRADNDPGFENIYHALGLSGLNQQFHFTNCRFDGGSYLFDRTNQPQWQEGLADQASYPVNGKNIYIGPVDNLGFATPSVINFNTCTIQGGQEGFWIDGAQNITINGCWFENLERGITIKGTTREAKSINIMNNLFGRSAGRFGDIPDGFGSVITYENAQVNVLNNNTNNFALGEEIVKFITLENNGNEQGRNLGVNTFGNTFEESKLRYTWGVKKEINLTNLSSNIITTESAKLVYLTNYSGIKIVNEIISSITSGELICIRANQGSIRFNESTNIYLGNMKDPSITNNPPNGQLTLNNGGFALFVKSDDGSLRETYNLISYKNRE